MGEALGKLFVPLHSLPGLYNLPSDCVEPDFIAENHFDPTFGGILQLLFLAMAYGYILFISSNMIADGSELLLLIPEAAPIVGSVVLPILGAVPDGAIIVFSGLGPKEKVQEELSVGVGALAGSTIMLITLPWMLSVYAGRVTINNEGMTTYQRPQHKSKKEWRKLDPKIKKKPCSNHAGVEPNHKAMTDGAKMMFITSIGYIVIQGAAFAFGGESEETIAEREKVFALAGFIYSFVFFIVYIIMQVKKGPEDKVLQDVIDAKRTDAIKGGQISLQAIFFDALRAEPESKDENLLAPNRKKRFEKIVRTFFNKYDRDRSGDIDKHELALLLKDLGARENVDSVMKEMDEDRDGHIGFDEFVIAMEKLVTGEQASSGRKSSLHEQDNISINDEKENSDDPGHENPEDDEEEDEMPHDLLHLNPKQQRRRIIFRSFRMMFTGTALVLFFSDPMVAVLSEIGTVINVPSFYVAFILAPMASNASELIASMNYAAKKTRKTITISLTSLEGAAIMNNTFGLGLFLAIVYFRGLRWSFSAETIAILLLEYIIAILAFKRIHTTQIGFFIGALFPLSIAMIAVMEGFGLD